MPFQPINFASIAPMPRNTGLDSFLNNLLQGLNVGAKLANLPAERESLALQNEMQKLQNESMKYKTSPEFLQKQEEAQRLINALNEAKAKKELSQLELPFGGETAPGSVGQAQWVEMLRQKYGDQSPVYLNAKRAFDADVSSKQNLMDYRNTLSMSMDKRSATGIAKTAQELEEINQGFMPGSGGKVKLNPEVQKSLKDQYELKLQKDVSDSDSRKRALFASNVDKTIEEINPKDLTIYSGAIGAAKLKKDQLQSALGHPSEDFKAYNKALTLSALLAKQVRQFYGDSITPQIQEKLAYLTNPSTWLNAPEVAISNFETFKDILQKETSTYRGAIKSTEEFKEKKQPESKGNLPPPGAKIRTYNPKTGKLE